jgi:cell surface protein SprA
MRWDLTKNLKLDFAADNLAIILEPEGKIDTKEEKQAVRDSLLSLGTTMNYHHTTNVTYNIPVNKIPVFDWINPTVRYSSGYNWQRAPLAADSIGATIGNNSKWDYTAQLNKTTAYNHSKYLKKINSKKPGQQPAAKGPTPKTGKPMSAEDSLKQKAIQDSINKANNQYIIVEYLARLMMSLRTVSVTYSVNSTMALPGYNRSTQMLGFDKNFQGPGAGFLFGQQNNFGKENVSYPEYAIGKGYLVHTQGLYTPFTQGSTKNFTARATLEPFPDVRIELTANRTMTLNNSQFIHWNPTSETFDSLSHTQTGSFSMSIIAWKTSFIREGEDNFSKTFEQFLNNRAVISQRLALAYPVPLSQLPTGFYDGYSSVQQDVIIPAFIAAYTGKNASNSSLNLFPSVPMPNWNISYDGLTKYTPVKKIFKTITLNHTYRSTYSLTGFQTNLDYQDINNDGFPDNVRTVSGDLQTKYQIGTVQISEMFQPLVGVNMVWTNSLSTKVEFKKDRTLSLSLANTQLTEVSGRELVVGAGYRVPKLPLKFMKKIMRGKIPTSDLNIHLDVSYRNNQTVIRKSVENLNLLTAGQNIFSIKSSIDYQLTSQLQIRFFCDRIMTNPLISSAFKTANTNAGLSLRFMLQ